MRFLWVFVVVFCVRCDQTTLSTTTSRYYTEYPIPTIYSDTSFTNHDGDKPSNLFRWKHSKLRRQGRPVEIWAWDLYCQMQPVRGNCKEEITRYYYDSQMDSCTVFLYSGCNGNKNNFETILDCERRCKGANFMGVKEDKLPTVCYLQADSGLCLAFMTNYYYDVNSRACVEFTYGGCGGNLNRFDTKAECEEHCKITKKKTTTTVATTTTNTTSASPATSTTTTTIEIASNSTDPTQTEEENYDYYHESSDPSDNEDPYYYYEEESDNNKTELTNEKQN